MVLKWQEDLKELMMDHWAPALQAALGDQWRDHFQAELSAEALRADGPPHVFEGLLPTSLVIPDSPDSERAISFLRMPESVTARQEDRAASSGLLRNHDTESVQVIARLIFTVPDKEH